MNARDGEWWSHSACPEAQWLPAVQRIFADEGRKDLVFFDVGCNKGYTTANFMTAFAPSFDMSPAEVHSSIQAYGRKQSMSLDRACGVCGDCNDKPPSQWTAGGEPFGVHVHCFEPSPASFKILQFVKKTHGVASKRHPDGAGKGHMWEQHNLAVYSESTTIYFNASCASHGKESEKCGIVPKDDPGAIPVAAVTVDDFVKNGDSLMQAAKRVDIGRYPDILKIDAEGFDPAVLQGSHATLKSGQTPIVFFEFNPGLKYGLWLTVKLDTITKQMDRFGYDCYFSSNRVKADHKTTPSLYRITGDCMSFPIRFRGWSNVICGLRAHEKVAKMLYGFSFLDLPK